MNRTRKDGGAVLLREEHLGEKNAWDAPLVGWKTTSEGVGGLFNPRGYAALRIVLHKAAAESEVQWLYDQPVLVENPGSIVIVELREPGITKVGLIRCFRMVGERLGEDHALYVRNLDSQSRWGELVESLGEWKWEAPRGLVPPTDDNESESNTITEFVLKTAMVETAEEAGFCVTDARVVGRINANPTFFPHSQYVVRATLERMVDAEPEDLEIMERAQFFTPEELRCLVELGELDDALTLGALALCGISF